MLFWSFYVIAKALAELFDDHTQILGVRSRWSGGMIFVEIQLEFDADKKSATSKA